MTTLAFDTLKYVENLRKAGISPKQAKAHVETLKEVINDNLATKADIERLRLDIVTLRQETKTDIERLRQETKANINELGLKMTIKLGGLIGLAVVILATIIKF